MNKEEFIKSLDAGSIDFPIKPPKRVVKDNAEPDDSDTQNRRHRKDGWQRWEEDSANGRSWT